MTTEEQMISDRLAELGYPVSDVAASLRQWQTDAGLMLEPTGEADALTVEWLFGDAAARIVAEVYPQGRG